MMSEWFVESANYASTPFPRGVNECEVSGMSTVPSEVVKVPRVGDAAVQLECKVCPIPYFTWLN